MYVYIFRYISLLTDRYHPEGGAVIIAESLDRALELLEKESPGSKVKQQEKDDVLTLYLDGDEAEKVFIFPNSGCC